MSVPEQMLPTSCLCLDNRNVVWSQWVSYVYLWTYLHVRIIAAVTYQAYFSHSDSGGFRKHSLNYARRGPVSMPTLVSKAAARRNFPTSDLGSDWSDSSVESQARSRRSRRAQSISCHTELCRTAAPVQRNLSDCLGSASRTHSTSNLASTTSHHSLRRKSQKRLVISETLVWQWHQNGNV